MARSPGVAELFKSLSAGDIRPVCAVTGEDSGMRAEILARVRAAVLGEADTGTAQVIFGPPDPARPSGGPQLADVLDELRTPSLFARRKLVLVRAAGALLSAPQAAEAMAAYVRSPAPDAVLLLEFEKLDRRTALAKALAQSGTVLECPRLYASRFGEEVPSMDSSLGSYLSRLAAARGLRLSEEAGLLLLLTAAQGDTSQLAAELDKLDAYLGSERRQVSAEDVEALAARTASDLAPVVRGALAGRSAEALEAMERVYSRGMDLYGRIVWDEAAISMATVNALGRELQTVERAVLAGGRCPPTKSGKAYPPQIARPIEAAARRLGGAPLERAYRLVLNAELELKGSSGRSPRETIGELLLAIASPAAPAPAGRRAAGQ